MLTSREQILPARADKRPPLREAIGRQAPREPSSDATRKRVGRYPAAQAGRWNEAGIAAVLATTDGARRPNLNEWKSKAALESTPPSFESAVSRRRGSRNAGSDRRVHVLLAQGTGA